MPLRAKDIFPYKRQETPMSRIYIVSIQHKMERLLDPELK